ncbi:MAG: PaaI family thioesterase [Desulfobacterales bacterium]|nr:PaaI family thioesterase [Desulfobacterales bacterium]
MNRPNPEYIHRLKETVRTSHYPSHMHMTLDHIEMDKADIGMALHQCHLQPYNIVHGGVLATLIDTATFWAAFLRLPQDTGLVNVDLKLNYLSPVVSGQLTAQGICIKPGRTISYAQAQVVDEKGKIITHGTSTLMALPGKELDLGVDKFLKD